MSERKNNNFKMTPVLEHYVLLARAVWGGMSQAERQEFSDMYPIIADALRGFYLEQGEEEAEEV